MSFCKTVYFVTLACFSVILIYPHSLFSLLYNTICYHDCCDLSSLPASSTILDKILNGNPRPPSPPPPNQEWESRKRNRKKWKRSDSSDSDSVALMAPLTTPIFDFH